MKRDLLFGLNYTEGCRHALQGIQRESPGALALAEHFLSWGTPPFSIGCREEEYDESLQISLYEALLQKVGKGASYLVDRPCRLVASCSQVFTLSGNQTSMGSFGAVRAMGPQVGKDPFGIEWDLGEVDLDRLAAKEEECQLCGWTRSASTWIEVKICSKATLTTVCLRAQEDPISFHFYIKGDRPLGLLKKSLQRYRGPVKEVSCDALSISLEEPLHVEGIPLAGSGAFWNADFLISFTLPRLSGWTQFNIEQ